MDDGRRYMFLFDIIMGILYQWDFAVEFGFNDKENSIRFQHIFGKALDMKMYIEIDVDVLGNKRHIPKTYEVEMYLENQGLDNIDIMDTLQSQMPASTIISLDNLCF